MSGRFGGQHRSVIACIEGRWEIAHRAINCVHMIVSPCVDGRSVSGSKQPRLWGIRRNGTNDENISIQPGLNVIGDVVQQQ